MLTANIRVSFMLSSKHGHSILAPKIQDGDGQNTKLESSKWESIKQRVTELNLGLKGNDDISKGIV